METPTHEEVEKDRGGDFHSHNSFSSASPSPMHVWNSIPGEWEEDGWGAQASPSQVCNNVSCQDPHKAGLRLDTSCEATRLQEVELLHPPLSPSQPETKGSDMFVWTPNMASWRRFSYLRSAKESSPENHVLGPAQDTSPHYPSKKIQKTKTVSADKDDKQCYDSEHSSRSMPKEILLYENDQGENYHSPAPSRKRGLAIGAYVVQCNDCQKWRLIPFKKYEEFREETVQNHFTCQQTNEWKLRVTCDDPTDISQDDGGIWAIDKPGIPQPPPGWERTITIRSEWGTKFADVYYIPPTGKTLRSTTDVAKYLEQNPQYAAGVQLSQFSFKIPAPLQQDYVRKRFPQSKALQPERVLPLASAPPIHEDNMHNMLMTYKEADPAPDMPQDQLLGE